MEILCVEDFSYPVSYYYVEEMTVSFVITNGNKLVLKCHLWYSLSNDN